MSIEKAIQNCFEINLSTKLEKYQAISKANEEWGELNEAILIEDGLIDKECKEDAWHEAADTIQCILSVLGKHYPELTPAEMVNKLTDALNTKNEKWIEYNNGHTTTSTD